MIVAAAIKFPFRDPFCPAVRDLVCFVPAPGRHHHVLHAMHGQFKGERDRTLVSHECEVQGFLTDKGEFLNRRQALEHAKACGQSLVRNKNSGSYQGPELFSEDLW